MGSRFRTLGIAGTACAMLLALVLAIPLNASARVRGIRVVAEVGDNVGFLGVEGNGVFQVLQGNENDVRAIGRYSLDGTKLGETQFPQSLSFAGINGFDTGTDGSSYFTAVDDQGFSSKLYKLSAGGGQLTAIYSPDNSVENHGLGDVTVGRDYVHVAEFAAQPCDPGIPGACDSRPPPTSSIRSFGKSGGAHGQWVLSRSEDGDAITGLGADRGTGDVYAGIFRGDFQVDRFWSNGTRVSSWGKRAEGPGNFGGPIPSVAVDGDGRVWVSSGSIGGSGARAGAAQRDDTPPGGGPTGNYGLQMFTKAGSFLSGAPGGFQDLVAYGGRIFGLEGLGNDAIIYEFGDTPDLDVAASKAKWKQKRKRSKITFDTKCNVGCGTLAEVAVRLGKKYLAGTPRKRDNTYTTATRSFKFRLKRAIRKQVAAARADGQKVRAYALVYTSQPSYPQPVGEFDYGCQTIAIPKPTRKPRTRSFRKCTASEYSEFFD